MGGGGLLWLGGQARIDREWAKLCTGARETNKAPQRQSSKSLPTCGTGARGQLLDKLNDPLLATHERQRTVEVPAGRRGGGGKSTQRISVDPSKIAVCLWSRQPPDRGRCTRIHRHNSKCVSLCVHAHTLTALTDHCAGGAQNKGAAAPEWVQPKTHPPLPHVGVSQAELGRQGERAWQALRGTRPGDEVLAQEVYRKEICRKPQRNPAPAPPWSHCALGP